MLDLLFEFIISQCKQNGRFSEKLNKESHFEVGTEYHGTRQSQDQMKVPSSAKIKGYKFNLIVLYFLRPARHNLDRHSEELPAKKLDRITSMASVSHRASGECFPCFNECCVD